MFKVGRYAIPPLLQSENTIIPLLLPMENTLSQRGEGRGMGLNHHTPTSLSSLRALVIATLNLTHESRPDPVFS